MAYKLKNPALFIVTIYVFGVVSGAIVATLVGLLLIILHTIGEFVLGLVSVTITV